MHAAAQKNKKLSLIAEKLENVRKAYETLPPPIKGFVEDYVIFPKKVSR